MSCALLEETKRLLRERGSEKSVARISIDTDLSLYWLNNLLYAKKEVDPSVTKIVRLYEYLSGKKLDV